MISEEQHVDEIEYVYKLIAKTENYIKEVNNGLLTAKDLVKKYDNIPKLKAFKTWIDNTNEAMEFIVNDDFYGYYQILREGYSE